MRYVSRKPAPPLDQFVDDVYSLSGAPRQPRVVVPPMPSAHLMINLGMPVRLRDSDPAMPPAAFADGWLMGVWSRRLEIEYGSTVRVVGVHFKPWGVAPFIRLPLSELRDRWVPMDAVWHESLDRMRNRLADASSVDATLSLVERELMRQLGAIPPNGFGLVRNAAASIEETWGSTPVASLADLAGVSGNRLASLFTSHVGVTPKRLARIYRFARVILTVDAAHPVEWAALAQAAGYFDQSHLINEFKDFTGHTPTGYLDLRRRFPAESPLDMGPMPAE
jgi:AraC-like DNA-binding protein